MLCLVLYCQIQREMSGRQWKELTYQKLWITHINARFLSERTQWRHSVAAICSFLSFISRYLATRRPTTVRYETHLNWTPTGISTRQVYTYEHGRQGIPWQLSACTNSVYQALSLLPLRLIPIMLSWRCLEELPPFCSLTFCSISENRISDEGTCALSGALQVNQSLQELKWVQPFILHMYMVYSGTPYSRLPELPALQLSGQICLVPTTCPFKLPPDSQTPQYYISKRVDWIPSWIEFRLLLVTWTEATYRGTSSEFNVFHCSSYVQLQ